MIAYKYDSEKKYLCEVGCQLDPLTSQAQGKDVWLLPANSTFEKPLKEKEGYYVVWNGSSWEYEKIPEKPAPQPPTYEEQRQARAEAYCVEVDPITSQISRLRDEEQTTEIVEEINELLQKRNELVVDIKERYPYPVGE